MTERLLEGAGRVLGKLDSRRGFLRKAAFLGSALALGPVRVLTRPESGWAITPSQCGSGLCTDGFTTFCCTLTGANGCPSYSYPAGWWKCDSSQVSCLCGIGNMRYYLDCNRTPGQSCPGGCQCANGSCNNRRTCCNVFRYGQCNQQISGVTEVVCRVSTCTPPWQHASWNCTPASATDSRTCGHTSSCLC